MSIQLQPPAAVTPGKRLRYLLTGWVDSRAGLSLWRRDICLVLAENRATIPLSSNPLPSRHKRAELLRLLHVKSRYFIVTVHILCFVCIWFHFVTRGSYVAVTEMWHGNKCLMLKNGGVLSKIIALQFSGRAKETWEKTCVSLSLWFFFVRLLLSAVSRILLWKTDLF
jgi:hypothetical protein